MTNSPFTTLTPRDEDQHLLLGTAPHAHNEGIATLCQMVE